MKKIAFFICFSFSIIISFAQQPSFITDSIDTYINKGIKQWNIPGLAIVIVKDGKVVVMKGYGVRDLETKEPVDENTLVYDCQQQQTLYCNISLRNWNMIKNFRLMIRSQNIFPGYQCI